MEQVSSNFARSRAHNIRETSLDQAKTTHYVVLQMIARIQDKERVKEVRNISKKILLGCLGDMNLC